MRLPRDISGLELAKRLESYRAILADVADHLGLDWQELLSALFKE